MKTFKFSLVLRTRENTDVFISLDDNIYGIHSKRINILYIFSLIFLWKQGGLWYHNYVRQCEKRFFITDMGKEGHYQPVYLCSLILTFIARLQKHCTL